MSRNDEKQIPQADPGAGYLAHREEIDAAIKRVLESGLYILGREVESFESEFAKYIGVEHAMGVGNGTDAIELALRACGVSAGDLVFTVSHTAVATVAAIESAGAVPVMIDIDPDSFTMNPDLLDSAISVSDGGRAKAVIPVHLYGNPCNIAAVLDVARRHGLKVIEDCAQSHGASVDGRRTGAWGDVAAFSFYPTKNLGGLGDGGMVVTNDAAVASSVRVLRQYGWKERYISEISGRNSRLDELHAAVLRVKLQYLDAANARRQAIARLYSSLLSGAELKLPQARPGATHVFHQYAICLERRDALRDYLRKSAIGTLVHYPVPVHLQPAYAAGRLSATPLPVTEKVARQVVSLPMFPELSDDSVKRVADRVLSFLDRAAIS